MKRTNRLNRKLFYSIFIVSFLTLSTECFSQIAASGAGLNNPVIIQYNYPLGVSVKYLSTNKILQNMEFNGQSVEATVNSTFGCTIKATGSEEKNLKLEVNVDTLGQTNESPMGYAGGGVNEVTGKSFNVIIAPDGKGIDLSEAGKITYTAGVSGESNLLSVFYDFFPVLPVIPVKPGDKWSGSDSVKTKTSSMEMKMYINSENRLDSIEMIDGIECARISATLSGTQDLNIQSQGAEIKIKGPYTGTQNLIFSLKDGYFLRNEVTMKMTGTMEMSMPESMSVPIVMTNISVNEVKK